MELTHPANTHPAKKVARPKPPPTPMSSSYVSRVLRPEMEGVDPGAPGELPLGKSTTPQPSYPAKVPATRQKSQLSTNAAHLTYPANTYPAKVGN